MAPKRRKSGPIPFSLMHIGNREKEQIDSAFDAIRANGTENDCTEAVFVRQQLALHASYVDACSKLEAFADEIRVKGAHLVPTRFPMRLTQRTRTSVGDGMYRSFLRCMQDLQCSVAGQHNGAVGDAVTNTDGFLVKLANVLTLESCRVLDGLVSHSEAREVCMSYIQKCRADVVREESAHLLTLAPACEVVLGELNRFGKRATNIYQCVPTRMRAFLKTAERKRLSTAAARLAREPQLQTILAKHSLEKRQSLLPLEPSKTYQVCVVDVGREHRGESRQTRCPLSILQQARSKSVSVGAQPPRLSLEHRL